MKPSPNRVGRPARGEPSRADHVVAIATGMFLRGGYGAVSIDAIAQAGGMSKATIYRHFTDKQALFGAVVSHLLVAHVDEEGLAAALTLPPETGLPEFANISLDLMSSEKGLALFRLIIGGAPNFPEIGGIFYERAMGVMISKLENYLARQHVEGRLRVPDAGLAAFQFLGLYKEALFWPRLVIGPHPPLKADRATVIARAVEIFLASHRP